jgi:DNA-binding SARP family transcriptional activator
VRIGLLGPLQAVDDAGVAVRLPGARLRVLLAALALSAGTPVTSDTLAEFVWDGMPPPGYATTLRSHVMRLRRALPAGRIETLDTGYVLSAEKLSLDIAQFEDLCSQAAVSLRADAWEPACDAAARALGLWRGAPLADVPSQLLRDQVVPQLDQMRVQALEDRAEAELALGRHGQLVAPLRELVAQYPLRERFHAQLMLALARSGRRAQALTAYQEARKALVVELGIEPGPELRALHERILAGREARPDTGPADRPLAVPPAAPSAPATPQRPPPPAMAVARQLPAAAGRFTGRSAELAWLTGLAPSGEPQSGTSGTVVICAVNGMAGIGKTALAVYAAHSVSGRFPDGQLFVDLHGYTKGYPPRKPGDALSMLLRALGVPARGIPEDTEGRAALYRQRLADTRTLILLDNARDEAQVRPLLPGVPGCLVLVTSRKRLKGLHDAHVLALDVLPEPDALALLRANLAPARSTADDLALREIVELCGRLPLALRIAGALLRHRPDWMPPHLAAQLRDHQRRLAALTDGEHDLRAVLDLSYTALDEQHRLLLRRLALVPGPELDPYAAAALLGRDPHTATALLEDLVDHNLLLAHAPGRYRLHDLIRAHARTLVQRDPANERTATLDRLLQYYEHTAHTASIPLARYARLAPDAPVPAHAPALPGPAAGRAWLRVERENLEAAHAHARAAGLDDHAVALATGLTEILRSDGPLGQAGDMLRGAAETAHRHGHHAACATALTDLGIVRRLSGDLPGSGDTLTRALEMCREIGHRGGEASAMNELGMVKLFIGDAAGAGAAHEQAVAIFQEIGHRTGEASALTHLGVVRRLAGDLSGSSDALAQALEICREIGHRSGEASALAEFGAARRMAGDLPAAAEAHLRALEICREIGHRDGEATVLAELGTVRRLAGDLPGANDALTRAVEIYRQFGHRPGEAHALTELGRVRHLAGDTPAATRALHQALETFREIGHRNNEAWALNHYAATVAATGDLPRALALYRQALAMNRELNKPDDEALSLEGLGECHLTDGEPESAIIHFRQALEIYQRLGMTRDADRVSSRLGNLTATS